MYLLFDLLQSDEEEGAEEYKGPIREINLDLLAQEAIAVDTKNITQAKDRVPPTNGTDGKVLSAPFENIMCMALYQIFSPSA